MSDRLAIPQSDIVDFPGDLLPAFAAPVPAIDEPRRVYLDKACEIFALVSPQRYAWVSQWRWGWRWDRTKTKRYATRTSWSGGRRVTVYMHKAILAETGKIQPTELHTIGDHQDGESLNNQDDNLEWATVSQNRRNRKR